MQSMAWNTNLRGRLPITCLILQVTMVVLFGVFVRYDIQADAHWWLEKKRKNISSDVENEFYYRYPSKSYDQQALLKSLQMVLSWLGGSLTGLHVRSVSGPRVGSAPGITCLSQSLEKWSEVLTL